jgi:hypothetical protein
MLSTVNSWSCKSKRKPVLRRLASVSPRVCGMLARFVEIWSGRRRKSREFTHNFCRRMDDLKNFCPYLQEWKLIETIVQISSRESFSQASQGVRKGSCPLSFSRVLNRHSRSMAEFFVILFFAVISMLRKSCAAFSFF